MATPNMFVELFLLALICGRCQKVWDVKQTGRDGRDAGNRMGSDLWTVRKSRRVCGKFRD